MKKIFIMLFALSLTSAASLTVMAMNNDVVCHRENGRTVCTQTTQVNYTKRGNKVIYDDPEVNAYFNKESNREKKGKKEKRYKEPKQPKEPKQYKQPKEPKPQKSRSMTIHLQNAGY